MKKILVFASGNGSNFEAIVKYFSSGAVIIELLCDKKDAYVFKRAKKLGIKSYFVKFEDTYDFLKDKKYNLFVLAGYMRILPECVLKLGTFVNIHPSLLPKFKGKNAIERAFESREEITGVTIHYVNSEVDCGEIIVQETCKISDDMEMLKRRIHSIEHKIYPKVIEGLLE